MGNRCGASARCSNHTPEVHRNKTAKKNPSEGSQLIPTTYHGEESNKFVSPSIGGKGKVCSNNMWLVIPNLEMS